MKGTGDVDAGLLELEASHKKILGMGERLKEAVVSSAWMFDVSRAKVL